MRKHWKKKTCAYARSKRAKNPSPSILPMRATSDETTVGSGQKQPLKAAGARRTTGTTPETPEGGAASKTEFQRKKVVGVRYDVSWIEYQALTAKGDGRDTTAYLVADPAAKPYTEKDVIDSLRAIGQLDGLLGIGSFDTRSVYELIFKTNIDQRAFTQRKEVTIKGHTADVFNPDGRIVKGKLRWLTLMTRKDDVAAACAKYGKMLLIRRQRIEGQGGPWYSNTLEFEMELNEKTKMEDIPAKIKVGTWTALVLIQGQPAVCFRCKKRGHIRAKCRATKLQQEEDDETEGSDGDSDAEDSVDETDTVALTPTLAERQEKIKEKKRRRREKKRKSKGQQNPTPDEKQPGNELPEKETEGSDGIPVSEDIPVEELDTVASTPKPKTRQENQETQQQEAKRKRKGQQDPSAAGTQPCDEQEKEEMEVEQDAQNSNNEEEPKEKRPCVDPHSKIGEEEPVAETMTAPPIEKDEGEEVEMRLPSSSSSNRDSDAESTTSMDFSMKEFDFSLYEKPTETIEKLALVTKQANRTVRRYGQAQYSKEEALFIDKQLVSNELQRWMKYDEEGNFDVAFEENGHVKKNISVTQWREWLTLMGYNENNMSAHAQAAKRLASATTAAQEIADQLTFWEFFVRGSIVADRIRSYRRGKERRTNI